MTCTALNGPVVYHITTAAMVSLHPNGVTIVAHHSIEWYEANGWEHSLNGVEYHVIRNRDELLEQLQANAAPERLVTTFVRHMDNLFEFDRAFNGNISGWDVSNVISTQQMFWGAHAFNGDLSAWDTSQVISMAGMFYNTPSFNCNLSAWNTSSTTNM
jgi:surface protein